MATTSTPAETVETVPPDLTHLIRMTDGTGLLQHARYGVPDRRHGYCLDDNARALWLMARLSARDGAQLAVGVDARIPALATTYASFVDHAWDRDAQSGRGRFENFMSFDRHWLPDDSTGEDEDAQARGVLALAHAATSSLPGPLREWAASLLVEALRPPTLPLLLGSPRAWAASLVACRTVLEGSGEAGEPVASLLREAATHADVVASELAERLLARFRAAARTDWPWFEDALAYDNARLCEGALAASDWEPELRAIGFLSLEWLCGVQTDAQGHHRPFGNQGFGVAGLDHAPYDQQPIEAWATVDACLLAHRMAGEGPWLAHAHAAARWFTGRNETGETLICRSGGSADGIGAHGINRNRGAESTLAWLHVCAAMQRVS